MKKEIMVVLCSLLLVMPGLSFAQEKKAPDPSASAYEHANDNARFKRSKNLYNNKKHKELRAKWKAEKVMADEKKKVKEDRDKQDKGEGQFRLKF